MEIIYKFSALCMTVMLLYAMEQNMPNHSKQRYTDSSLAMQGPVSVSYCDLVSDPTRYDRIIIVTEAIEVLNLVPVLDGGEPFLYLPMCDKSSSSRVLIDVYESYIDPASNTFKEMEKIVLKAKEKNQSSTRVKVQIVGRFFAPKPQGGYGHLGEWRFKLVANKIERVEEVPEETPWPLGYEPAKRQ